MVLNILLLGGQAQCGVFGFKYCKEILCLYLVFCEVRGLRYTLLYLNTSLVVHRRSFIISFLLATYFMEHCLDTLRRSPLKKKFPASEKKLETFT